jgi:hypothetical protein
VNFALCDAISLNFHCAEDILEVSVQLIDRIGVAGMERKRHHGLECKAVVYFLNSLLL